MNGLAFDTCFAALSVGVRCDRGDYCERLLLETCHAEALMPMIARVMRAAGLAFGELERIVVTQGPGTFTGVRTGISAARALALATGAPLIGVSSLWAIAAAVHPKLTAGDASADAVLVAMDARKSQVYVQAFDARLEELSGPQLLSAGDAGMLCPGRRLHLIGNAARLVASVLECAGRPPTSVLDGIELTGQDRNEAAAMLHASSRAPCAGPLQPLYLRPPDAKPQADKSLPWVAS